MANKILLAYATRYESTREVAAAIAETLGKSGLTVDIHPAREVRDLAPYSAVVLGAPLFMFRWHKDALRFLSRHQKAVQQRPIAIFALGPVHDPYDDQEWQNSWDQFRQALAKFTWLNPVALELFGGRYDPEKLRFPLKMFAGDEPPTDIRDWAAIDEWAGRLPGLIASQES